MKLRRGFVPSVDNFTIVPNDWARDPSLSRRAKGLLVELLSHREGWEVSIESLRRSGTEGREAIRKTIIELETAGYLRREQQGGTGGERFGSVEYVLLDPAEVDDVPVVRKLDDGDAPSEAGSPPFDSRVPQVPHLGNEPANKTNQEDQENKTISSRDHARPAGPSAIEFDDFWAAYPRKVGKQAARAKFVAAVKRSGDPQRVIAGAHRLAADPNLPDARFVPHPTTWLARDGWEDEPMPEREERRSNTLSDWGAGGDGGFGALAGPSRDRSVIDVEFTEQLGLGS